MKERKIIYKFKNSYSIVLLRIRKKKKCSAIFQMMFAIITPALICGAIEGRMRFSALFIFITVWTIVVYYPLAHMVWGDGGFIRGLGARALRRYH